MASGSKEIVGAEPAKLKLYSYWRSSCSQRVRIALNLKGLDYEYETVNLLKDEQFDPEFEKLNPIKYVPSLVDGDVVVGDSLAIILYLEDKYPQHPLLPKDLKKKALNLQVANIVGSSIQPLQNLSILKFIETKFDADEKLKWVQHYIGKGFSALEKLLKDVPGKYATGDEVLLADVFLAPQIDAGVARFRIDMTEYPRLARAHAAYSELPAFQAALPERQPDYPASA
ncbi:glutathione S-transferase zeta class-like [Dioscorea cayenensis subsp. rotundata]|uniref:glutathione transferase n=1 Tax=Dioscorea cayennensis subsp. rotundata TaxID=55577 RepID=A0AB40ATA9_DIOCR|nr:glutathione S-transferase zeta class-like [Dioscorea cayenensis subsp. rotundata]